MRGRGVDGASLWNTLNVCTYSRGRRYCSAPTCCPTLMNKPPFLLHIVRSRLAERKWIYCGLNREDIENSNSNLGYLNVDYPNISISEHFGFVQYNVTSKIWTFLPYLVSSIPKPPWFGNETIPKCQSQKLSYSKFFKERMEPEIGAFVATMRDPPPTLFAYNHPCPSRGHVKTTCSPDWHEMPAEDQLIMMEVGGGGERDYETYSVTSSPKPHYAKWGAPGAVEHLQLIARISCWRYYRQ